MARAAACGLAIALALSAPLHAAAREPAELAVLTYNIHGLPGWIARDDPPARIPLLLAEAERYDLVLLQEDFAYQALVEADARHPRLWRGNGPWLPLLGAGSGLTILSRLEHADPPEGEPYGVCAGWVQVATGNDCWGNKGWLFVRLALPNGAQLDVWDTHLDAGPGAADLDARRAQLERLAAAIEGRSGGRALLVGGDLNLEWNDPADRAALDAFRARVGLEVAARTPDDGWDRRIDYLLIRSGDGVEVAAIGGGKDERFLDPAGAPLSDHPAIFARLRVR